MSVYHNEADEMLVPLIANGSVAAFDEIYKRYAQKMFSYFYRMLWKNKELAEDFTQELFMKIMAHAYRFETDRTFSTWMYSIANNMCKNEYRKKETQMKHTIAQPILSVAGTEKNTDLQKFKQALSACIGRLPEEKQTLFTLRFQEQLSIPEISAVLKIPEGTIKSRVFYLLKDLKDELSAFKNVHIYP